MKNEDLVDYLQKQTSHIFPNRKTVNIISSCPGLIETAIRLFARIICLQRS